MEEKQVVEEVIVLNERRDAAYAEPIVISMKKGKKKRKKRYSKGLDEIQTIERHLTRASHRIAKTVEKGLDTYQKKSKKSAHKKRDGVIRDFIPNSGLAISHALEGAGPVVYEMAQAFDTKQNRRRLKRQLRIVSRTMRMGR